MNQPVYTVITFAPVQGFIEKSRKLRDLYGSSFILSYLAKTLCEAAHKQGYWVVSPAIINVTQGTPNQIIIRGNFAEDEARKAFDKAWEKIVRECRLWVEASCQSWIQQHLLEWIQKEEWTSDKAVPWKDSWDAWKNHAWEFFIATGETISQARENLNEKKRSRSWIGVNWMGESSSLSGADAVAWPGLGRRIQQIHPKQEDDLIKSFYKELSQNIGKAFINFIAEAEGETVDFLIQRYGIRFIQFAQRFDKIPTQKQQEKYKEYGEAILTPEEQISIPELIKRLITLEGIAYSKLEIPLNEIPKSYRDLSRLINLEQSESVSSKKQDYKQDIHWTGWFQGDGDSLGNLMKQFKEDPDTEEEKLHQFSKSMMNWGEDYFKPSVKSSSGQVIYAGGDDFLGVFYRNTSPELTPKECLEWFHKFRSSSEKPNGKTEFSEIWSKHQQPITVSVGFVWAAPSVPQRDVLQHCKEAEQSAKKSGRDRITLRILFNSGNHLEWTCPWWLLQSILTGYCDRNNNTTNPNWTHIYNDVAILEARHAFSEQSINVVKALFEVYFPDVKWQDILDQDNQFNANQRSGVLGEKKRYTQDGTDTGELDNESINQAINDWVINLAKIGFHLLGSTHNSH
jgi:CRISPR-associated protein Cmr2